MTFKLFFLILALISTPLIVFTEEEENYYDDAIDNSSLIEQVKTYMCKYCEDCRVSDYYLACVFCTSFIIKKGCPRCKTECPCEEDNPNHINCLNCKVLNRFFFLLSLSGIYQISSIEIISIC